MPRESRVSADFNQGFTGGKKMRDLEARLEMLESRLRKVEDHLEVLQIVGRYGPLVDSADTPERLVAAARLWADEGTYDAGPEDKRRGDEIAERLGRNLHQSLVRDGCAHVMSMPHVWVKGERAAALGYSQVFHHVDGTYRVRRSSINFWEFERRDGTWTLVYRTNRPLNGSAESKALLRRIYDKV
jgi:hypothetical protein